MHNKFSPLLIGDVDTLKDKIIERNIKDTKSLRQNNSIEDFINSFR